MDTVLPWADTPRIFTDDDKLIRHRLRALHLKQWKRGRRVYAESRKLGVPELAAAQAAANARRCWHNGRDVRPLRPHHPLLRPIGSTATCRFTSTFLTARMRTRMSGRVAGEQRCAAAPYADRPFDSLLALHQGFSAAIASVRLGSRRTNTPLAGRRCSTACRFQIHHTRIDEKLRRCNRRHPDRRDWRPRLTCFICGQGSRADRRS